MYIRFFMEESAQRFPGYRIVNAFLLRGDRHLYAAIKRIQQILGKSVGKRHNNTPS